MNIADINVEKILRIIPGRRKVVLGTWHNKRIVAKLFFDKRRARRHFENELAGLKLLQQRNIPTPKLYHQGKCDDQQTYVMIFEYLHADIDLSQAWQQHAIRDELMPLLKMLVLEIATQHVFGLEQRDLHLNNFVIANNAVYTLDGAQIEYYGDILPKKDSMQNLALLFSQLGVDARPYQEELLKYYVQARGWILKPYDVPELFSMIDWWGKERWKKYEKKIFRTSTHFQASAAWRSEMVCGRAYMQPEVLAFLKQPESVFKRKDIVMLKNGRSSTVIRVKLDDRELVIKRYNIKHAWHWLRRCFRTTRAKKCWRIAQKLNLFGIQTASPVAYIENRFLGLRGKSYFVTEYVAGSNIKEYLQQNSIKQNKIMDIVNSIIINLKKIAITHGDLKASNIVVTPEESVLLIDLDGAREHDNASTLEQVSQKEWQRFLRNFKE